ncbi:uncharacterized protein BBA_09271 [Beauveria bassiana ARSEF 2860]|uniref:Uncharacterized protein n=1 Tax=Beauveria bassiana (strain ARSEF 2860) TaxID=655819 RepID=J4VTB0_BEAB2|nr:uncharacterized protein BBA_09271 [Beauveria bassiana ARSEF 2860]EJP61780.1 hypothetical protein BBA_09271 [Beauveria bassiana ARSEF 2860]
MKSFIALSLLAAAALGAPQLVARDDATKPVKEADTSRADCWKRDPGAHHMLPPTATLIEDCTGTIEYCLRGFYSMHGEEFDDADACLRSRDLDPATAIDAMRIVSQDDLDKGYKALKNANHIYNRYMIITLLTRTFVPDEMDQEANDFIEKLRFSTQERVHQARDLISQGKTHYKLAFGSKHDEEIEAAIEEAKGKLNAAWIEIKGKDTQQMSDMFDWFKERSEEKYFHDW